MAKDITIGDLSERITLIGVTETVDDELNRIETLVDLATVWAFIEFKSSNFDKTATGERPEVRYKVTMRKNDINFLYIRWRGTVYNLDAPKHDVDRKYTVFEMVGKIFG